MSKLRYIEGSSIAFWCPGCDRAHVVALTGPRAWTWNNNFEQPTISPSILIRIEWSKSMCPGDDPAEWRDEVCHSFVRGGQIEFLPDCTHLYRGLTVLLPDWPS